MIFLLDTDTCSAHMRRPARLAHRFIQYTGGLAISTIVLGEHKATKSARWPKTRSTPRNELRRLAATLRDRGVVVTFGKSRHSRLITITRDRGSDNSGATRQRMRAPGVTAGNPTFPNVQAPHVSP